MRTTRPRVTITTRVATILEPHICVVRLLMQCAVRIRDIVVQKDTHVDLLDKVWMVSVVNLNSAHLLFKIVLKYIFGEFTKHK